MASDENRRAVIYSRLSRNRDEEQSASTRRQTTACRKLAKERGLNVVAVFTDDDVSAYSGKPRPGYEAMMETVAAGETDAVITWAADRLHRAPRELEDFVDAVDAAGVDVLTVQGGRVDLSTAAGRMNARMLGTVARYESEHRSARTRAAHEDIAQAGRWHGGLRPYGYRPVDGSLVVVEEEAEIIREVVARIIAGERPGTVAADLNRRGVPTARGSAWTTPTLRTMAASETIAGRRRFRGEDIGPAAWEAIIDTGTSTAVRAVLAQGARRGRLPAIALLSGGRLVCGRCGGPMRTARRSNKTRLYRCPVDYTMVTAEPLEDVIVAAVLRRLEDAAIPDVQRDRPRGDDVATLEAQLGDLAADMGAGAITRAEWMAARQPLLARIDAARAAAAAAVGGAALAGLHGKGAAGAAWPELDLGRRQAIVDALIDSVTVAPATRRGPGLDLDRIDIRWKG